MTNEESSNNYKQAMALVNLLQEQERQIFKLASDKARVERQLSERTERANTLSDSNRKLGFQILAIEHLHNADEPDCEDGCCFKNGESCHCCNEPYPCATIKALRGSGKS